MSLLRGAGLIIISHRGQTVAVAQPFVIVIDHFCVVLRYWRTKYVFCHKSAELAQLKFEQKVLFIIYWEPF